MCELEQTDPPEEGPYSLIPFPVWLRGQHISLGSDRDQDPGLNNFSPSVNEQIVQF